MAVGKAVCDAVSEPASVSSGAAASSEEESEEAANVASSVTKRLAFSEEAVGEAAEKEEPEVI